MHNLIDSHFHLLELEKRDTDPTQLLSQLEAAGFAGGMDIGVAENDLEPRLVLTSAYPNIRIATGIGPWGAEGQQPIEQIVERFRNTIMNKPIDAIGEIGLDYYWNYGTTERQKQLFRLQIELANELQLPIVIHARDADEDMIQELQHTQLVRGGIMHCFSSSKALAEAALAQGLYISFAGPITYKKNEALREVLASIPLDCLLLETDSPYLSPEPYRGKINTPFRIVEIYKKAAEVRQTSFDALAQEVLSNFTRLFPPNHNDG